MLKHLTRSAGAVLSGAAMLFLLGCAAEAPSGSSDSDAGARSSSEGKAQDETANEAAEESGPRQQAEECGWDTPALGSPTVNLPAGGDSDLQSRLVGAWQHTHYDSGEGFTPLGEEDIRYIFPSTERMLYCQHIPGVTYFAEQATDITLDGQSLVLPGAHPGFTVQEWSDTSMVWVNNTDGSLYLLQRR